MPETRELPPHIYPDEEPTQKASETLLASNPDLAELVDTLADYRKKKSKERAKTQSEYAKRAYGDPDFLVSTLDNISALEELKSYPLSENFGEGVENALGKAIERRWKEIEFPPQAESMEKWLTLYAESEVYGEMSERMLKKMVERCKDPKEITDFLYNLTLGGLTSSNRQTVKKTMEILHYATDVFSSDSQQAIDAELASFVKDNDTVRKNLEILDAKSSLRRQFSEFDESLRTAYKKIYNNPRFSEKYEEWKKESAVRKTEIETVTEMRNTHIGDISYNKRDVFPWSLLKNRGPLRKWSDRRFSEEFSPTLFPDGEFFTSNVPMSNDLLKERLQETKNSDQILEESECFETLAHLTPEALEQFEELRGVNDQLIEQIKSDTKYLLSPRGDLVEITDFEAKDLSFKSILYEMNPQNKLETVVTIEVGNYKYRLLLDENYALRENTEDKKSINLSDEGVYLEYLVLSHLREVRCTNNVQETSSGDKDRKEQQRKFGSRRPHRRKLPAGKSYTEEQFEYILGEYGINLKRLNKELGNTRKDGMITFVRESMVETGDRGPVRSKAPQATNELKGILEREAV